jgi:hypothetical protein
VAAAALAVADEDRSSPRGEVVLGHGERFLDAQPGLPNSTTIIARSRQP